jgi:hypothetical protein
MDPPLHSFLNVGDDVGYFTPSSRSILYGRIVFADPQSFTVQRYEPAPNTVPFLSLECENIDELRFTEQREVVTRISVDTIIFVLSEADISKSSISLAGMTNVRCIRFHSSGNAILLQSFPPLVYQASFIQLSMKLG